MFAGILVQLLLVEKFLKSIPGSLLLLCNVCFSWRSCALSAQSPFLMQVLFLVWLLLFMVQLLLLLLMPASGPGTAPDSAF